MRWQNIDQRLGPCTGWRQPAGQILRQGVLIYNQANQRSVISELSSNTLCMPSPLHTWALSSYNTLTATAPALHCTMKFAPFCKLVPTNASRLFLWARGCETAVQLKRLYFAMKAATTSAVIVRKEANAVFSSVCSALLLAWKNAIKSAVCANITAMVPWRHQRKQPTPSSFLDTCGLEIGFLQGRVWQKKLTIFMLLSEMGFYLLYLHLWWSALQRLSDANSLFSD